MPASDRLLQVAAAALVLMVLGSGALAWLVDIDLVAVEGFGLPCVFFSVTGIECPGCGITRALLLLGQARVAESLWQHPLAAGVFLGALFASRWPDRFEAVLRPIALPLLVLALAVRIVQGG